MASPPRKFNGTAAKPPKRGALAEAAHRGDLGKVQALLTCGGDVNDRLDHWSALHWTIWLDRSAITRLLIEQGADVNAANDNGITPLMWAVGRMRPEAANLLLENGANPDAKDSTGKTALMLACEYGHADIAQLLLDNGARPDEKDERGKDALTYAKKQKNADLGSILKKAVAAQSAQAIDASQGLPKALSIPKPFKFK